MEADPDAVLVTQLQRGEDDALQRLMRRHDRWVRGIVLSTIWDRDDLDDVVQQVWLNVWKQAASLDNPERWRPWLYRLATNAAIDRRRHRRFRQLLLQKLTAVFGPRQAVERRIPLLDLQAAEQHERALRAIKGLPEIYREPFAMRHLSEFGYDEIAETLGITIATVKTRLTRARQMLRETLLQGDEHA